MSIQRLFTHQDIYHKCILISVRVWSLCVEREDFLFEIYCHKDPETKNLLKSLIKMIENSPSYTIIIILRFDFNMALFVNTKEGGACTNLSTDCTWKALTLFRFLLQSLLLRLYVEMRFSKMLHQLVLHRKVFATKLEKLIFQ
jgi:hypothetical protein